MENQETNEKVNETKLFFEKLKELQKSTPPNVSIFMCAINKSEDNSEGILMCDATGGELVKMFSQACIEVPKLSKAFEAALAIAKLENDPLGFLKGAFEKSDGKFPFPFPFGK